MAKHRPIKNSQDNTHSLDVWEEERWMNGRTEWIEEDGNSLMWEYINAEYLQTLRKSPAQTKVLVLMCGNSQDMLMLYNLGCIVVGVEYVGQAIERFFGDHNISTISAAPTTPWKNADYVSTVSEDGRMIILQGDILKLTIHNTPHQQFDLIWDREAFGSINIEDMNTYASVMMGLLAKDGLHLINKIVYDQQQFGGSPSHIDRECLLRYDGANCSVVEVNRQNSLEPGHPRREKLLMKGITSFVYEVVHIIKKK